MERIGNSNEKSTLGVYVEYTTNRIISFDSIELDIYIYMYNVYIVN